CSIVISAAFAYTAGARDDILFWTSLLGSFPVGRILVSPIAFRLFPPVTISGDYRSVLFESRQNGEAEINRDIASDDEVTTAGSVLASPQEFNAGPFEAVAEADALHTLDLDTIAPSLRRVRDLRHHEDPIANRQSQQPRSGLWLSLAL